MALLETTGVDWELDTTTWDLIIPLRRVSGAAGVAQRIGILLRLIRGEWFANTAAGMPWFQRAGVPASMAILGQAFAEVRTRAEVRNIITSVEGVRDITRLGVVFNAKPRKVMIDWRVRTIWGNTAEGETPVPLA